MPTIYMADQAINEIRMRKFYFPKVNQYKKNCNLNAEKYLSSSYI